MSLTAEKMGAGGLMTHFWDIASVPTIGYDLASGWSGEPGGFLVFINVCGF